MSDIPKARIHKGVEFLEGIVKEALRQKEHPPLQEVSAVPRPQPDMFSWLSNGPFLNRAVHEFFPPEYLHELRLERVKVWSVIDSSFRGHGVRIVAYRTGTKERFEANRTFGDTELLSEQQPEWLVMDWMVKTVEGWGLAFAT